LDVLLGLRIRIATVKVHRRYCVATAFLGSLLVPSCVPTGTRDSVRSDAALQALTHVRVIDGTGTPAREDQTLIIRDGRITALGATAVVAVPGGAQVLDLSGRTVIPGLVGMHEHLFYGIEESSGVSYVAAPHTFATLYLAAGVTTIRTAGTIDFEGDLRVKELVDAGHHPGPRIHLTSPYIEARSGDPNPEQVARDINAWAEQGATSFKAGRSLRAAELRAAVEAAHARGLRVTGHLCAIGFREAAAIGIDNLEHGLIVDTEFDPDKRQDQCPEETASLYALAGMDLSSASIAQTISSLVSHGVAVTSTLAVYETFTRNESALDPRTLAVLSPRLRDQYEAIRALRMGDSNQAAGLWGTLLSKEMKFERAFAAAGGLLMSGADPTGWGGLVAGFGDQRQLELLVQAGFTPEAAIKVATRNGASFLNEYEDIGTVAVGRRADIVVVRGNPSARISDVRNVEMVFKGGVAYDPDALIASVAGTVGGFEVRRLARWPLNVLTMAAAVFVGVIVWRRMRGAVRSHN
jgi:imidazolonepropionase-like amidohydrolase